ncbi:hypothetical protein [Edaphocola aurantiacus]|uniref:hypothetical protein n=1 Tax=Edaphocola aurantiacus TaxID=2601682 RepID=UPI001C957802|nr:hypothetical protein [Edaphocola aurantiacus]
MSISFINFNSFSKKELCQFIVRRCYENMRKAIRRMEAHYVHQDFDTDRNDDLETALPFIFLQFKESCEQLMLWEEKLILPYFQDQDHTQSRYRANTILNPHLLTVKHEKLKQLYDKIKFHSVHDVHHQNETLYQIMRYDLLQTNIQLLDWEYLIQILLYSKPVP